MLVRSLIALSALSLASHAFAASCPAPGPEIRFPDGTLAMRTPLAVNPDGATQSYTPGDHGYTYMNNGLNLWIDGKQLGCSNAENKSRCRKAIQEVEAGDFGKGTPELCVYAMEVAPLAQGQELTPCGKPKSGRYVAGNGKGRLRLGPNMPTVDGQSRPTYVSTTSVRHTKDGKPVNLDSAALPVLVTPLSRLELSGAIAWVRFGDKSTFAIFGDSGPRFGEGSVALHQLLRAGTLTPQALGPIPAALRCGAAERALRHPFVVRPDLPDDKCKDGKARSAADIRAYSGIASGVDTVVLPDVKLPMKGRLVQSEVTIEALTKAAKTAGFEAARLAKMADCLR